MEIQVEFCNLVQEIKLISVEKNNPFGKVSRVILLLLI